MDNVLDGIDTPQEDEKNQRILAQKKEKKVRTKYRIVIIFTIVFIVTLFMIRYIQYT